MNWYENSYQQAQSPHIVCEMKPTMPEMYLILIFLFAVFGYWPAFFLFIYYLACNSLLYVLNAYVVAVVFNSAIDIGIATVDALLCTYHSV